MNGDGDVEWRPVVGYSTGLMHGINGERAASQLLDRRTWKHVA